MKSSNPVITYENIRREVRSWSKSKRIWYYILLMLADLYAIGLVWVLPALVDKVPVDKAAWVWKIPLGVLGIVFGYFALQLAAYGFSNVRLQVYDLQLKEASKHKKRNCKIIWFFIGFLITFGIMMIYWYAYYPGGASTDNFYQWNQIQTGVYDDWHPVFHTFQIWLVSRICNQYGFVVLVQLLLFALGCGYLLQKMASWNFPAWTMIVTQAFIIGNSQTRHLMLYLWKDGNLVLFLLFTTGVLIEIFLGQGAWFAKKRNLGIYLFLMVFLTLTRHNGIFYTIPMMVFLIWFMEKKYRKKIAVLSVASLAIVGFIKGPVYKIIPVETFDYQTYTESVGMPMTILLNVKKLEPEQLDPEIDVRLDEIIANDPERWETYDLGRYNSMKGGFSAGVVDSIPPVKLIGYTMDAVKNAPTTAIQAMYQLTRVVWDVRGEADWENKILLTGDSWGYDWTFAEDRAGLRDTLDSFDTFCFTYGKLLDAFSGTYIVLLILVSFLAFWDKGFQMFYMTFPMLAYNFGTMVMLCGIDARYFQFNAAIVLPICFTMLTKQEGV